MAKRVVPVPLPRSPVVSDVKQFGAFIRSLRTQQGLTTADAAALCGVSVQLLNSLEAGNRAVGLDRALQVAKELGLSVLCTPSARLPEALGVFPESWSDLVSGSFPPDPLLSESLSSIAKQKRTELLRIESQARKANERASGNERRALPKSRKEPQ